MRGENVDPAVASSFWQSANLKVVLDNMTDAFAALDRECRIAHVNRRTLEIAGRTYDEVVGHTQWELFPDLKGSLVQEQYEKAFRTGQPVHFEFHYPSLAIWLEIHAYPIDDFLHVFFRDITQRKESARQQDERETSLRSMVDAIPQIAWSAGPDGMPLHLNRRWKEYTGQDKWTGEMSSELIHPDDRAETLATWQTARESGSAYEHECRMRGQDGQYRWFLIRSVPVRGSDGEIVSWFGTSTDIHSQKVAEQELSRRVAAQTQELRAANRELESFTYSVSHDLRGPMRAISSCSMILLEDYADKLPDDAQQLLQRQSENAKKLSTLVEALLQLSRVGRQELKRTDFNFSDLASEVGNEVRSKPATDLCELVIEPDIEANGDPQLVKLVLTNLIENACKFSPGGGTILVGKTEASESPVYFVRDEGIGFESEYAEKIFLPFERLVRDSDFAGTGIGLANVERIIRRHGGKVWAESEPGKGSTFYFTLAPQP